MSNYSAIKEEYLIHKPAWDMVRDCIKGARAVKSRGTIYLPMPDPTNDSKENLERYRALLKRAMFLNVTDRTMKGLIGAVFRKSAEVSLPKELEYLQDNASGDGSNMEQLAKAAVAECLETGRGGFFVDYPVTDGINATLADTQGITANIHLYTADQIINWREDVHNGSKRLSMVVLKEHYTDEDGDEFTLEIKTQYRALTIDENGYRHRLWKEGDTDPVIDTYPTDYNGNTLDHIPFSFFGSESNDACIDKSPLEDLASVNILHYGNSATVEESGFISSQATLFFSTEMSFSDFREFNPNGIQIGATCGYNLGANGSATMVQASESNLARSLMLDKEKQMLMIGARIVQDSSGAETAEAVRIRYSSDNSVLGTIAGNVSDAMVKAIKDAALFMMPNQPDDVVYWLNQEFFDEVMDSNMILAQVQLWQQGIIAKSDIRTNLRQSAILEADRKDEEIDEELNADPPVSGFSDNDDDNDDDNEEEE